MRTLQTVALIVLLVIVGCGGGGAGGGLPGTLLVNIQWPVRTSRGIPEAANSIVVAITIGNYRSTQTAQRPASGGQSSLTFSPPSGVVHAVANAYPQADGTGTSLATFAGPITVASSGTTNISLTMNSTIVAVSIDPGPIPVVVGHQTQASAIARDARHNIVLLWPGEVTWSSQDPSTASVDPTGAVVNVTGVKLGSARIQATDQESGKSGTATANVANPGIEASAWPKYRGDLLNSGRGQGSGAQGTFGTNLMPALAVARLAMGADGTLYFGDATDDNVYAVNSQTGAIVWQFATGAIIDAAPAIGADGTVYVVSYDGNLYALDGATGAKKWSQTISIVNAVNASSPTIGSDGTVYVGSQSGQLFAIDGSTGSVKWSLQTGNHIRSSPAIGPDGTIYVGSGDAKLYAVDPASGTPKWTFQTNGEVSASPSIANGMVYVPSTDGTLYAIDAASGSEIWSFTPAGGGNSGGVAIATDGSVYLWSNDRLNNYLYALDGTSGSQKWATELDKVNSFADGGYSPSIGSDGTIYIDSQANLYALDPGTGSIKWTYPNLSGAREALIGPNGRLYLPKDPEGITVTQ